MVPHKHAHFSPCICSASASLRVKTEPKARLYRIYLSSSLSMLEGSFYYISLCPQGYTKEHFFLRKKQVYVDIHVVEEPATTLP